MASLAMDLRYALRALRQAPLFAAVAVLSLALGIGANTAVFTLLDQVMLRLLPVPQPEQLVQMWWQGTFLGSNTGSRTLSYPMYQELRDHNQVLQSLLCRYTLPLSLGLQTQSERVQGELVSGNYFDLLGAPALLGRHLTPADDNAGNPAPVAVLSFDYWRDRFAQDPSVLGREILINGHKITIIGVSQPGFDGVDPTNPIHLRLPVALKVMLTPGASGPYDLKNDRGKWLQVFGRMKPGLTVAQAAAGLQPVFAARVRYESTTDGLRGATPYEREEFLRAKLAVEPGAQGQSQLRRIFGTPLWVLMAIVGVVLLIACANVASLLMARAASRRKEVALRLALGAGRARLIRAVLAESLILALAGGLAGLALAFAGTRLLLGFLPADVPLKIASAPDLRIFTFAFAVSLLTGLLFGLAPALQGSKVDLHAALKEEGASVAGGQHVRLRKLLVTAQVALSLLLLIAAGLFLRTLDNLKQLQPGFQTARILTFSVDPARNGYNKERAQTFYRQLLEKLRATAGIESASLGMVRLLNFNQWDSSVVVEGYHAKPGEDVNPYYNAVSPQYFSTLQIPLLAGRDFRESDLTSKRQFAVVNEKFAKYFFENGPAVGRHMGFGDSHAATDIEIIGVVKDAKYKSLRDETPRQVFVPYDSHADAQPMNVYVRTATEPRLAGPLLQSVVRSLDPALPLFEMRTLQTQMDFSLVVERLVASLAAVFGLLATALAAVGLYGVMAFNVARRTREIGLRMALGAARANVLWMVMREVLTLVAAGSAIALPCAYGLSRLVASQLYGVHPNDPVSLSLATLALALVAALAGYLPALRATRIDPMNALRHE